MTAHAQAPARREPVPFGTTGPRPKQPSSMLSVRVCQGLMAMAERREEERREEEREPGWPGCVRWVVVPDREAGG
jgi:hypothetical protein